MILTRKQWREWMGQHFSPDILEEGSVLYIPEEDTDSCQIFVYHRCLNLKGSDKKKYWAWCKKNLKGDVRCFWSNPEEDREWWGFIEPNDVAWWLLKWA
jgi:hypothetical protein